MDIPLTKTALGREADERCHFGGGTGTRLHPLTRIVNKHLLPVGSYPMISYGIERFRQAGIKDILLVIGKQSAGLYTNYLGSGRAWG